MHTEMTSAVSKPLVSIGMGIYNAEQFLTAAMQSILSQDYSNFELVIIDNGSSDGSERIYRDFAERDPRISFRKNARNINPLRNWCMLLESCSGVYHAWAADHDLYHPKYISSLVNQFICSDDSLIMAYSDALYIDVNDKPIRNIQEDIETRGLSALERFKKVMWGLTWCTSMYGLFRAETLKKTFIERSVTGPDRVFMAEYSLLGTFARHKEPLFFMRQNRPPESYVQTKKRQMKWFVPDSYETFVPTIMRDYEHIKVVHASDLNTSDKETLVEDILRWHHADPEKHSEREIRNLVLHGLDILSTGEHSDANTVGAAEDLLRIAKICILFRPGLSHHINELCAACTNLIENNSKISVETQPHVTIGMTVYNQSPYLQKTIDSILAQSYQNYEVIIVDNASEDNSAEIGDYYAKTDKRIRLIKHPCNIGMVGNMDFVFHSGRGDLFLLSTGHDVYHPDYLSTLVNTFEANSDSVVMCYPQTAYIDEKDHVLPGMENTMVDTRGMEVAERFVKTIWHNDPGSMPSGLYRKSALLKAWNPYLVRGPGHMVAAEISLIGEIIPVRATLFHKRIHRQDSASVSVREKYAKHFSLTRTEAIVPYTLFAFEHINMVQNSTLSKPQVELLSKEIRKCFSEKYGLQNEAISFLQKGVELLKSDAKQVNDKATNFDELNRLARICGIFNTAYKPGFEQFSGLIDHMLAN